MDPAVDAPAAPAASSQANDTFERPLPGAYQAAMATKAPNLTHAQLLAVLREALEDPITRELMLDPVVTTHGDTYERRAIAAWLERQPTDPATRGPIGRELIPNQLALRLVKRLADDLDLAEAHEPPPPVPASALGYELRVAERMPTLSHISQLLRDAAKVHSDGTRRVYRALATSVDMHRPLAACGLGMGAACVTLPFLTQAVGRIGGPIGVLAPPGTVVPGALVTTLLPNLSAEAQATFFLGAVLGVRGLELVRCLFHDPTFRGAAAGIGTMLLTMLTEGLVSFGANEAASQFTNGWSSGGGQLSTHAVEQVTTAALVAANLGLTLFYYVSCGTGSGQA